VRTRDRKAAIDQLYADGWRLASSSNNGGVTELVAECR
jgi:hypothetical protein